MAVPIVLIDRVSVTAGKEENIVLGRKGTTLTANSMIAVFLNRESVDVTFTMFVGAEAIMEVAGAPIQTVAGSTPSFQDDKVITTFGQQGQLIVLNARNANVAAQEAGFILQITELDDAILQKAAEELALAGLM